MGRQDRALDRHPPRRRAIDLHGEGHPDGHRRAEAARGQGFRSHRHSARRARLLRRRIGKPPPGRRAVRQAEAVLRSHRGARHQPRRALQARARIVAGLGDAAGRRQAGEGRRGQRPRLRRQELLERRRPTPRASRASTRRCPSARRCRIAARTTGRSTSSPPAWATTCRSRFPTGAKASPRGASTCRPAAISVRMSRTRCWTARSCAPAKRCR